MNRDAHGIPGALNAGLVVGVATLQAALLYSASRTDGWLFAGVATVFAFLFLTNYALMHEASHGVLHPDRRANALLGAVTGLLFPTSATMMRVTHAVHHRCNRTDHEMFDCYYDGDSLLLKRLQWYSILTGFFYLIIPIGAVAVGFLRPLLLTRPFKRSRSSARLYDDFDVHTLSLVRAECLACVALYGSLFWTGILAPLPTLFLFILGGINWSTRQYVTHAWSRRDVIHGAHNLSVNPLMRLILLNGHWDLVHHQHPTASWTQLPRLGADSAPPIPFWRQYLSLWRGPRPATETGPEPLPDMAVQPSN